MESHSFSIGEVLKTAWTKFKQHPFTWVGALILCFLISFSEVFVNNWVVGNGFPFDFSNIDHWRYYVNYSHNIPDKQTGLYLFGISILYFLIKQGLTLGLFNMGLKAADGLPVRITQLFARFYYVFHYLIATILYVLILVAGFILLFFPACIWGSSYALYPFFIIDKGAGPIQALKMSSQTTYGAKWDVFCFIFISFILALIGLLAFVVGMLFVFPIIIIGWAFIYRRLVRTVAAQPVVIQPTVQSQPPRV